MVVGFGFSVIKVVNVSEFIKGNLTRGFLPEEGLDLVIASGLLLAALWTVLISHTGLARGWSERHEKLGKWT